MEKRWGMTGKLFVFLFTFVGCVGFWYWAVSSGDHLPLVYATSYTVLTLWTFDRWFTIRREKL